MANEAGSSPMWCVVANMHSDRNRLAHPSGSKHFVGGAKLYCMPPLWGDGYDQIKVVGRHRGSLSLVVMVVQSATLTNWCVRMVYRPAVIARFEKMWTKEEATALVAVMVQRERSEGGRT